MLSDFYDQLFKGITMLCIVVGLTVLVCWVAFRLNEKEPYVINVIVDVVWVNQDGGKVTKYQVREVVDGGERHRNVNACSSLAVMDRDMSKGRCYQVYMGYGWNVAGDCLIEHLEVDCSQFGFGGAQ